MPEKFWRFLAWRAPRRMVYWCALRLMAHATKPPYENQEVPSLLAMDALDRWDRSAVKDSKREGSGPGSPGSYRCERELPPGAGACLSCTPAL